MPMSLNQQHYRKNANTLHQIDANQWAQIWFKQLCRFHRVPIDRSWNFSAEQVIQFLRHRLAKQDPAWKRLKIVEALMQHQTFSALRNVADLRFIKRKLRELAGRERAVSGHRQVFGVSTNSAAQDEGGRENGIGTNPDTISGIVGKIDSRELVPIQNLRRKLRLAGKAFNTEIAYVGWVKRFLRSRGVTLMQQCQKVAESVRPNGQRQYVYI